MLPAVDTTTGFLPLGAHPATLEEIYTLFVDEAPNSERRLLICDALTLYFDAVRTFFPSGTALVDGGFTTHKAELPHDVDVVLFPDNPQIALTWTEEQWMDWQGMLTLHDVIIGGQDAAYYKRVQPFGGLMDGFLGAPETEQSWRNLWGSIRDENGSPIPDRKGYLEVRW